MFAAQDIRVGARQGRAAVPVHALEPGLRRRSTTGCRRWSSGCSQVPGLVDVSTDREQGGLQANINDRPPGGRAARRAHPGHRQRAQQRLLAAADLDHLHPAQPVPRHPRGRPALPARPVRPASASTCRASDGAQVPLTSRDPRRQGRWRRWSSTTRGRSRPSPSATISRRRRRSTRRRRRHPRRRSPSCSMPDADPRRGGRRRQGLRRSRRNTQPLLILAALIAVYIVLGVLYESLAHPLTIISTLPSAGLGALLALQARRHGAVGDRAHRHHPADRHRQEERHHAGRLRARAASASAGCRRQRAIYEACTRALPADPDDDACGAARRRAAGHRRRAGLGAAPPARHHHHRRPDRVAGAHALHDAGHLPPARQAAPAPVGNGRARTRPRRTARRQSERRYADRPVP